MGLISKDPYARSLANFIAVSPYFYVQVFWDQIHCNVHCKTHCNPLSSQKFIKIFVIIGIIVETELILKVESDDYYILINTTYLLASNFVSHQLIQWVEDHSQYCI